ncbi:MAG: hypothetical protein KC469_01650 [Flavobacteriaceae bacterium]|nr:hypothetical protein [Flavobacteriaceae bacterium]
MVIKKQHLLSILVSSLIIVLYFVNKIEVNVIVFTLGLFACKFTQSSLFIFRCVNSLILIFLIGVIISLFTQSLFFNIFKDAIYFLKPISAIVFGFYLFSLLNTRNAFRTIVLIGAFLSICHIYNILKIYDFNEVSIHYLRNNAGLNNFIEMISILVILIYRFNGIKLFSSITTNIIATLLVISFVFYFSRTMIVASLIMTMFALGYHRLSAKGFIILIISMLSVILFYWYLLTLDLNLSAVGFEAFLYKLRMAPGELFISSDFDVNNLQPKELRYLYDHWRGFEASQAISQLNGFNVMHGNGFGALVDLGREFKLDGENVRHIPIIHNGFVYVLFKTGIVGLVLYLIFLSNLFLKYNRVYSNRELNAATSISLAVVIFYMLSSFVITGIYNQGDLISLILGGMMWIQKELHSKEFTFNDRID